MSAARSPAGLALRLASALAPNRCVCCRALADPGAPGATAVLCPRCERRMPRARARLPPGTGLRWVVAPLSYEGTGRQLVSALKFQRLVAVAELGADLIAAELPPLEAGAHLVPVPAAPRRRRRRGFDPAELIAVALADRLGLPAEPLLRRTDSGRQRGRNRAERLRRRPRFEACGEVAGAAILVDDVVTTGATLTSCAAALAAAGAHPIAAVALAQTPPPRSGRLHSLSSGVG